MTKIASTSIAAAVSLGLLTGSLAFAQANKTSSYDASALEKIKKQTAVPGVNVKSVAKSRVRVTSPALRDAIALYRTEKFDEAQVKFDELLRDRSLDANDRGITEFFMGKVLFRLGFYYASVPYFQSIIKNHGDAVFYPYSFQRLIWIAKRDGMYRLLVDPLRQKKSSLVPRNYRDDVYYLFARTYFEEEEYVKAQQAIKALQRSNEYYGEGQLMLALMHLRAKKRDEAMAAFNEAAKSPDEDIKGLAQLGIARLVYADGDNKLAIQNYGQVATQSRHWMTSQIETAWAHFRDNEPSLALGDIHPFDVDPFDKVFTPETPIIRSTIFFRLCRYGDSERAILPFFERYLPVYRQIETFNKKYKNDPTAYRREVLKAVFRENVELPPQLTQEVFSQTWFHTRINQLQSLKKEIDRLNQSPQLASLRSLQLGRMFVSDAMDRLSDEVLANAVPLLVAWEKKLEMFFQQASLLRFESAYAAIDFERRNLKKSFEIPKDQQYEVWTFDEEYWRDELGDYRYLLRSECVEDQG